MTALATRPEDLRLAARKLQVAGADLGDLATRLAAVDTATAAGWQGVAALGQRMATQRVVAAVHGRRGPAEQLAASLAGLADHAESARSEVLAAQQERARATAERLHQIQLLGTTTDPGVLSSIRDRIVMLEGVIHRADDEIAWVEDRLEQGRRLVDQLLRDSWPGLGVDDLRDLVRSVTEAAPVWRGGGLVVVGSRIILTTVKLAKDVDPFVRFALDARLTRLLTVVRKTPVALLLTRLPYRVVVPLVVILDAWPDVWDGGGYEGWRGVTLRVTAAIAIPGSVAMVLPHPVAAGLGAIAVGSYYVAKGGFALWDHRLLLAQVGRAVYDRRQEIIETATKVLRPTGTFPLGPLGPMYPLVPGAKDLLSELPRLEELGRYLPPWGLFQPVIEAPIERGPRLPAIPTPSLGVVHAGIVLPRLIRLFR